MSSDTQTIERMPWNIGRGLPQVFRIGDTVRVRQDGNAPSEWCRDWADVRLMIIGTSKDEHREGRVCYVVHATDSVRHARNPMAEDWLEAVVETASDYLTITREIVDGANG